MASKQEERPVVGSRGCGTAGRSIAAGDGHFFPMRRRPVAAVVAVLALVGGPLDRGGALRRRCTGPSAAGAAEVDRAAAGPSRAAAAPQAIDPRELARRVTIRRDAYGVPHIDGETDASVLFGFAYAQAEDFFWQVEDTYILALGRYAEVHGPRGLNSDLLNRAFEVVPRSKADFGTLDAATRRLCTAFAAGLNAYLQRHPEVQPRLIRRFEPWHVLAFHRHITLELCFRYTRLTNSFVPRNNPRIWTASGSNAWAVSGSRTRSGFPMLMVNPHLPWFGYGQMLEAHLRSGEGWNMTGGTFYGSPMLHLGHNSHLGWTFTVNEPDVADVWRETFDREERPLEYRYGDGYRTATRWAETIRVKTRDGIEDRRFTFVKTHHGPVVKKLDAHTYLTARISGLHEPVPLRQALRMAKARNLDEFRAALAMLQMPIMNVVYADREGNIYYVYGGRIPRRDPRFDWSKPVDGSDPRTEWQGIHPLSDLPQVLNPKAGFIQSCNSTPFTTSDSDNPDPDAFPPYMIEDKNDDKRRAKRSREILRGMRGVTFDQFQQAMFDTTVYWARHELPGYRETLRKMETLSPWIARRVAPLLDHLLAWDGQVTADSTAATLCEAWYQVLYGPEYPGERLLEEYQGNRQAQLRALLTAARRLKVMHGTWKIAYGAIHRIQRPPYVADIWELRFDDQAASLPCSGAHGPMGVIFTQYYTPSLYLPLVINQRKRYGIVGTTYLAAYLFADDGVRGASLVPFGSNGNPTSPHYFDQAPLLSQRRLKPIPFSRTEVAAAAKRVYRPADSGDGPP